MKLFIEILFLIGFFSEIILGIIILLKNKNKKENIYFFFFMLSGSLWNLFLFFAILSFSTSLDKIGIFFGLYASAFFLLFVKSFGFPNKKDNLNFLIAIFLFPTIIGSLIIFSDLIFGNSIYYQEGYIESQNGPLNMVFYLYHIIYSIISVTFIYFGYKNAKGIRKTQFKYLLLSLALILFVFIIINLVLPFFGYYQFNVFGSLAFIIIAIFFLYIITRYRFFGIKFVIKRASIYLASLIFILFLYTLLILFAQQILIDKFNWNQLIVTLISVLIIAVSFEPLRRLNKKIVKNLFYSDRAKKKAEVKKKAEEYAKKLKFSEAATGQIEELVSTIVSTYLNFISSQEVKLLLPDQKTRRFEITWPKNATINLRNQDALIKYINANPETLVREEIPYLIDEKESHHKSDLKKIYKDLNKAGVEVVLPVGDRNEILGVFLMGAKEDKTSYNKEDIETINDFSVTCTPLLLNTILYKQGVDRIEV